ncbi:MAG: PsbP-related protein [Candidatus Saccharimonadales bacterium]
MQKQTKSYGFTAIEIILVIFVLSLIGAAVWYVAHANAKNNDSGIEAAKNVSKIETPRVERSNLTQYSNNDYGFSFDYPKDWEFAEELADQGRGKKEGYVSVTSPNGTVVSFKPNLGGKGGDCWDDAANSRTKNTCYTLAKFSVEQLTLGTSNHPVYFVTGSLTAPQPEGGKTKFFVGLESGFDTPQTGETFIDIPQLSPLISPLNGYVEIETAAEDPGVYDSEDFYESLAAKEMTLILKSFRFNKN